MPTSVHLEWAGPYQWLSDRGPTIFNGHHAETAGVYMWCLPFQGAHLVYYVGQTEAGFAKRHYDHFRAYTAGSYTIHRAASFKRGILDPIYQTRAYAKEPWRRIQTFIDSFGELANELDETLRSLVVFIAPLSQAQRVHRRLEAAMIDVFYAADPPSYRFQDPGMVAHRRRADEIPLAVTSSPTGLFHGLPDAFEA